MNKDKVFDINYSLWDYEVWDYEDDYLDSLYSSYSDYYKSYEEFYNDYEYLNYSYDEYCQDTDRCTTFVIPTDGNSSDHLHNIRTLLELEFGGLYKIIDYTQRIVETDLPLYLFNNLPYMEVDEIIGEVGEIPYIFQRNEEPLYKLWGS